MSDEQPTIEDPVLGTLSRATTELTDGEELVHDWFVGTVQAGDDDVEIMLESTTVEEASVLLPRVRQIIADFEALRRRASDAVVTRFSQGEPEQDELDDAASELAVDTIEASADGTIVLHLTDGGDHFPEGYWPAVHLAADDSVVDVTVES